MDNNLRADFFGPAGDTRWNLERLRREAPGFVHLDLDIRDRGGVLKALAAWPPTLVVHAAAQPSHDLAARRPFDDFEVNAVGTLNMLEAVRLHAPEAVFVFLSTNKVYGDAPNELPLRELPTRWDYARAEDYNGIREDMRLDRSLHSIFGASKAAADIMTQEYGRYFGLATVTFRCGCLTGPRHSGVELHGFLNYLFRVARAGGAYTVFGHKGKQVRDNLHSLDVIRAIECFCGAPRPGEVYNLGGGRENSCSVLEALQAARELAGPKLTWNYVEPPRKGDHICYITDLTKFRSHYPQWTVSRPLTQIYEEIAGALPTSSPAR
jgi:CDP-paratose 2-epimerase